MRLQLCFGNDWAGATKFAAAEVTVRPGIYAMQH